MTSVEKNSYIFIFHQVLLDTLNFISIAQTNFEVIKLRDTFFLNLKYKSDIQL